MIQMLAAVVVCAAMTRFVFLGLTEEGEQAPTSSSTTIPPRTLRELEGSIELDMAKRPKPDFVVVVANSDTRVELPADFDPKPQVAWASAKDLIFCARQESDAPRATCGRSPPPDAKPPHRPANSEPGELCTICFERAADAAVFPCGHVGLCYQCCLGIHARGGPCPFCRTKLDQIVTIDRRYPLYNAEGNVLFRVTGPNLEDVGTVKPDLDAAAHAERDDGFVAPAPAQTTRTRVRLRAAFKQNDVKKLLASKRNAIDALGKAAPETSELTRCGSPWRSPPGHGRRVGARRAAGGRRVARGPGKAITDAAKEAVAAATAGGGWDNEPGGRWRRTPPRSTKFITPKNILTLSTDDGDLVYVIRASLIDDRRLMRRVSVAQLTDFFTREREDGGDDGVEVGLGDRKTSHHGAAGRRELVLDAAAIQIAAQASTSDR
ncbi:hypothetical protein JL722_13869 [Aureococcus anophagefferens]|nr:hypothetical protein JL722_13869 [Aureococcus anophagefferens]